MREKLKGGFPASKTKPGKYGDGGGLYLYVKPIELDKDGKPKPQRKYWIFRWRDKVTGKLRDKGLGRFGPNDVSLKEARKRAKVCRDQVWEKGDPIKISNDVLEKKKLAAAMEVTFGDCITRYVDAHKAAWRNEKHTYEWSSSLNRYAGNLKPLPVNKINTTLVLNCLEPHWAKKTETMTRVRQRMEAVLDWATVRKYRSGDNPARWRGHLDKLLAAPNKLKDVQHLASVPYAEMGVLMAELRQKDSLAAKGLEFLVLTASRPGEVVGARWSEFDFDKKTWVVPAERMKAKKEHEVPLSDQAIKLLESIPRVSDFVFPGGRSLKKHMTTASMLKLSKELRAGITSHGFRSSFREWAGEVSSFDRDVIEHALAHQLKDKVEASYYRKTQFPRRVLLMAAWADYCDNIHVEAVNVTPIGKQA